MFSSTTYMRDVGLFVLTDDPESVHGHSLSGSRSSRLCWVWAIGVGSADALAGGGPGWTVWLFADQGFFHELGGCLVASVDEYGSG